MTNDILFRDFIHCMICLKYSFSCKFMTLSLRSFKKNWTEPSPPPEQVNPKKSSKMPGISVFLCLLFATFSSSTEAAYSNVISDSAQQVVDSASDSAQLSLNVSLVQAGVQKFIWKDCGSSLAKIDVVEFKGCAHSSHMGCRIVRGTNVTASVTFTVLVSGFCVLSSFFALSDAESALSDAESALSDAESSAALTLPPASDGLSPSLSWSVMVC